MSDERIRFKSTQDWNAFAATPHDKNELTELRMACYRDIEKLRGRPLITFTSKFTESNMPPGAPISISLADIEGFTDLINAIPKDIREIDVLIHSPGGSPDATERIVMILRARFDKVHFLVPHSAYSAATMLAMSGNSITLHPSAVLGPIDPQINGIPARSIKNGFDKVQKKITELGPQSLPAYIPLIEKYSIELLELCDDSEKLSKKLVIGWLHEYMFEGKGDGRKITPAVNYLADYNKHLIHSRPLSIEKLKKYGLHVEYADEKLSVLLWEALIQINGVFNMSEFVKMYESTYGIAWGKTFKINMQPI